MKIKILFNDHWHPEFFVMIPVIVYVLILLTIIARK